MYLGANVSLTGTMNVEPPMESVFANTTVNATNTGQLVYYGVSVTSPHNASLHGTVHFFFGTATGGHMLQTTVKMRSVSRNLSSQPYNATVGHVQPNQVHSTLTGLSGNMYAMFLYNDTMLSTEQHVTIANAFGKTIGCSTLLTSAAVDSGADTKATLDTPPPSNMSKQLNSSQSELQSLPVLWLNVSDPQSVHGGFPTPPEQDPGLQPRVARNTSTGHEVLTLCGLHSASVELPSGITCDASGAGLGLKVQFSIPRKDSARKKVANGTDAWYQEWTALTLGDGDHHVRVRVTTITNNSTAYKVRL